MMNEHEFLLKVLQGRQEAALFCGQLFRISQVIDDIQDGDKPVQVVEHQALIWEMLAGLPGNAFYQQHFGILQPLIRSALNDWIDSTELEATRDKHDATLAFVLRDQLTGVVSQCAYLIGGKDWLRQVSVEIRRYFHDEPLAKYGKSIGVSFEPKKPKKTKRKPAKKGGTS